MLYYYRFSSAVVAGATEMSAGATAGVFVFLTLTSQGRYKQSTLSVKKVKLYLTHPKHVVKLLNYVQVTH
jgi:hypothetical protein